MFDVYVLMSESTGKIYIGQTKDKKQRLQRHNRKIISKKTSYTSKNKGPWIVIYSETYSTRPEAIKREKYLKSHIGRDWLNNKLNKGP